MTFEKTNQFVNKARYLANNAQKSYGVFRDASGQVTYSQLQAPVTKGQMCFSDAMKFEGQTLIGWANPRDYMPRANAPRKFPSMNARRLAFA